MRSASKSPRHHQLAWHRRRALARPEAARKKRVFGRLIGGTRLPFWLIAPPSPCDEPPPRFFHFADRAGSRDAPSSPPMPHEFREMNACLPGRRRLRKRHFSAQQEIG